MPPDSYSVTLPEAELHRLQDAVEAGRQRLSALQHGAHCACESFIAPWRQSEARFHESWADAAAADEADAAGGLALLMATLRHRMTLLDHDERLNETRTGGGGIKARGGFTNFNLPDSFVVRPAPPTKRGHSFVVRAVFIAGSAWCRLWFRACCCVVGGRSQ